MMGWERGEERGGEREMRTHGHCNPAYRKLRSSPRLLFTMSTVLREVENRAVEDRVKG